MADNWITVHEAVRVSRYHAERIRELAREGRLKGYKIGIAWLVSRKSLDVYLREQAKHGEKRGRKPRVFNPFVIA
jgi:excisionase family DNA binding protein